MFRFFTLFNLEGKYNHMVMKKSHDDVNIKNPLRKNYF